MFTASFEASAEKTNLMSDNATGVLLQNAERRMILKFGK